MTSAPGPESDEATLLRERYGAPPRWSRPVAIALVSVVALVGLAWLLWAALAGSSPLVSAQVQRFEVASEHRISVTLTVERREPEAVRCEVYAQASDHSVVGERTFEIPAGGASRVTVEKTITTEREAVNALLRGCEVAPSDSEGDG